MFLKIRNIFLLFILTAPLFIYAQEPYFTFSKLRGMEDYSGNNHLFYRLYHFEGNSSFYSYSNNIYDLNLTNNSTKIFLYDSGSSSPYMNFAYPIMDYQFWDKDPLKYIFGGNSCGMECYAYLKRYDTAEINMPGNFVDGGTIKIQISGQNDSLLYAGFPGLYKSTDGGLNWGLIDSTYTKYLVALSPFNDQVLFASGQNGYLYKSQNGGYDFNLVDTLFFYNFSNACKVIFDIDSLHLYKVSMPYNENLSRNEYYFSVSSDGGDTWEKKNTFLKKIFISNAATKSGEIYLAEGKYIYFSNDYGNTFSLFQQVDQNIKGLYNQESTGKVYVITNYNLYEVTKDTSTVILNTPIGPSVFNYYPLQVGNKWIYSGNYQTYPGYNSLSTYVRKITDKKTQQNNKTYFELKEYEQNGLFQPLIFYERIDSLKGGIYRYDADSVDTGYEYLIDDLIAEAHDSINCYRFQHYLIPTVLEFWGDTTLFNNLIGYKKFSINSFPTDYVYILAQKFGLINFSSRDDNRVYNYSLKGAIIDGQIYGDTTVTGIDNVERLPREFLLSQNYPNPFNPSTIIEYSLPNSDFVTLKVFDVLGREVKTLVNKQESAGDHKVIFDAANLSSGIYFYRLTAGGYVQIKKMILEK